MKNDQITLELNGEIKKISINDDRKIYSNKKYDITIIEINPSKDGINDFLEIDEKIFGINKTYFYYNIKDIYILQYSVFCFTKFKKFVSYGKVEKF